MAKTNESPVGVGAPNRAKTIAQAKERQHGTAARRAIAMIEKRLSGNEPFDADQVALEHAALVAPIDLRDRAHAAAERQRIRDSRHARDPLWRLMTAVEKIAARGGV